MDELTQDQKILNYFLENDIKPDNEIWNDIGKGWGDRDDNVSSADNYLPRILEVMLDIRKLLILNEIKKGD